MFYILLFLNDYLKIIHLITQRYVFAVVILTYHTVSVYVWINCLHNNMFNFLKSRVRQNVPHLSQNYLVFYI